MLRQFPRVGRALFSTQASKGERDMTTHCAASIYCAASLTGGIACAGLALLSEGHDVPSRPLCRRFPYNMVGAFVEGTVITASLPVTFPLYCVYSAIQAVRETNKK